MKLWSALIITSSLFAFDYHLHGVKVTPNVLCFFGKPEEPNLKNGGNMVNTCAINGGDQTIIIDSGPSAPYAKAVTKALKTMPPIKTVINTHFHDDHLGGNSFYAAQNIPIIGHEGIKEHYNQEPERFSRMKNFITPDAYGDTTVALPTLTLQKKYTITTQKGAVEILHLVRKGHTDTDVVIYFPRDKILFSGDLVFNDRIFPIRDGDLAGWLEALRLIEKIPYTTLVPGHGTDTSRPTATLFTKNYLTALQREVKKALDDGVDMTAIISKVPLENFASAPLYKELHGKNILKAYEMLEMEDH